MRKLIAKYINLSVVAKAAIWFTLVLVIQKGISFITMPIFTRMMSIEQYGYFSVYLSWVSIFTIVGTLDLHTCAYINGLAKMRTDEEKSELAISLLNLSTLVTGILFLVFLVNPIFWAELLGMPSAIIVLMLLEVLFLPAYNFWATKLRYSYKYRLLVLVTIAQAILNVSIGLLGVYYSEESTQAIARIASISGVQVLIGIVLYVYFILKAKKVFSIKYWKYGLMLHIPLVPHGLSLTVLNSSDKIMIQKMISLDDAAIYGVAYSACMVINIIKIAILQAITPWIYSCIQNKKYASLRRNINYIYLFISIMIMGFILLGPELISIIAPSEYYSAIYVLPPVTASILFTFLYGIFSTVEFYFEKTKGVMIASLIAAGTNILLNFLLIPRFGFYAAGYTTLFCYMILAFAHYFMMRWTLKKNYSRDESNQFFNIKFLFIYTVVLLTLSILVTFLYGYSAIIRYCIISLLVIIVLVNIKRLIKIVTEIKEKEVE